MSHSATTPDDMTMTARIPSHEDDRPLIYVNGQIVPKSQAMVSVYDHGLLYGDGVFEGIRVYNGRIFKAQQHLDRLWASAASINMKIHISREEMLAIQRRCIEVNGIENGYIRLVVTRGVGTLGLNPLLCPTPGIICIADQISLYPRELYEEGMKVLVAERPRIPVACLDPRIKSLNYLNNILAKSEALERGMFEVVMLNLDGYVCEGSGDNIFIIKDGELFTAPKDASILEGITRRFVIEELCPSLGVRVHEELFKVETLLDADEIFLTGSAAEIIAVTEVQERASRGGATTRISMGEGPVTKRLRDAFTRVVTSRDVPED